MQISVYIQHCVVWMLELISFLRRTASQKTNLIKFLNSFPHSETFINAGTHFNTGKTVILRYNNTHTHTHVIWKHLFSLSQIPTNNKLQVQSCVFRSDNLLKQICFLICHDKWLSFISLVAPRTAGIWHSIRSGPGPVFWFHSGKRHSQPLCVHLAICQHLLRKQQRWQHTQGTTGINGNQITA